MAHLGICTDVGTTRSVNQDACCVKVAQTAMGEVLMAVVCDGVGGLSMGELASATVVMAFSRWFEEKLPDVIREAMEADVPDSIATLFDEVQSNWHQTIVEQNWLIGAYGSEAGERLGTTVTAMFCSSGRYLIAHVGDCRAYRVTTRKSGDDGTVTQITEDQTLLSRELEQGTICFEDVENYPHKNVILQAIGSTGTIKPAFVKGDVRSGDLFVIASDGAYSKMGDEGIREVFSYAHTQDDAALDAACRYLVSQAKDKGETDNLTVVCFSADRSGAR